MREKPVANSLSRRALVRVSPGQVSCEIDSEAVILSLKDGVYYGLNPVSARIWNLIQEPKRVEQIQAILLDEYEVKPDVCMRQVLTLLRELATKGLIEVMDEIPG